MHVASVSLAALLLAVGAAPPAVASEDDALAGFTIEEEATAARNDLLEPTYSLLADMQGFESGGFVDTESEAQLYYWHGDLPSEAAAVIEAAESGGAVVEVRQTLFSLEEFWQLGALAAGVLERAGIDLTGWGPNRAHDVIELLGPVLSADENLQETARTLLAGVLPEELSVEFVPDEQGVSYDSRHDDSGSPTPGGELYGRGSCTGGLGMHRSGYGHYMLTAAHCVDFQHGATVAVNGSLLDGSALFIPTLAGTGSSSYTGFAMDAALVSFGAGNGVADSYMFLGSNVTSTKVAVEGISTIPWGATYCTSGSGTGSTCNVTRTSDLVRRCTTRPDGSCWYIDIVGVGSTNGYQMFGAGDSGGAIYRVLNGERVIVATIQGGLNPVECTEGTNYYEATTVDPPRCSINQGRVTPMSYIMDRIEPYNVVPNTV